MKQMLILTVTLCIGLAMGFTIRDQTLPKAHLPVSAAQQPANAAGGVSVSAQQSSSAGFGEREAFDSTQGTEVEMPLVSQIESALSESSRLKTLYALEQVFASMTAQEARLIFDDVRAIEPPRKRRQAIGVFFEHWGRLDGVLAYDMAGELVGREREAARHSAMKGWADADVHAAWQVAVNMLENADQGMYRRMDGRAVFAQMAQQDPSKFLGFLAERSGNARQIAMMSQYYSDAAMASGNTLEYWQTLEQLPNIGNLDGLVESFFRRWGEEDSEQPLQVIAAMEDARAADQALQGFLVGWADADADAAVDFALQNLDNSVVSQGLKQMVSQAFLRGSAQQNKSLVGRIQSSELDSRHLRDVVSVLARTNPDLAIEMSASVADETDRLALQNRAIERLAHANLDAATAYFRQADTPRQKASLFNALNWHLVDRSDGGERLIAMLEELPQGQLRSQVIEESLRRSSYRSDRMAPGYREALLNVAESIETLSEEALNLRKKLAEFQ